MPIRIPAPGRSAALAALLALAACSGQDANLAALDNELLANGADPALTAALEDQILVDPNLVQQSHPNSVRPPETPIQAQYPPGPDPTRPQQASAGGNAATGCAAGNFDYGMQYARQLPAGFPAYPGGRVTEAAANNNNGCHMRVVTFTTGDAHQRVLDFYRTAAARAGYSAEQQQRGGDLVLAGVNGRTDGAFYLIVTPAANGSEVALIVNDRG
jgi:hypothetical protein